MCHTSTQKLKGNFSFRCEICRNATGEKLGRNLGKNRIKLPIPFPKILKFTAMHRFFFNNQVHVLQGDDNASVCQRSVRRRGNRSWSIYSCFPHYLKQVGALLLYIFVLSTLDASSVCIHTHHTLMRGLILHKFDKSTYVVKLFVGFFLYTHDLMLEQSHRLLCIHLQQWNVDRGCVETSPRV